MPNIKVYNVQLPLIRERTLKWIFFSEIRNNSSLKQLEEAINFVTYRIKSGSGKDYLNKLSKFIRDLLEVDYVLIVKYTPETP